MCNEQKNAITNVCNVPAQNLMLMIVISDCDYTSGRRGEGPRRHALSCDSKYV